jgi:hypothetical protein
MLKSQSSILNLSNQAIYSTIGVEYRTVHNKLIYYNYKFYCSNVDLLHHTKVADRYLKIER